MGLFRLYRADGSLQIDDELMTYCFVRKGQVQTQAPSNAQFASTLYVPTNINSTEVVAVMLAQDMRPADNTSAGFVRYMTAQINGGWFEVYQSNAPVGATATYYVFDRVANQPVTGVGLELFDSAGNMTLSSNHAPLVTAEPGFSGNFGGTVGRIYAAVLPYAAHYEVQYDTTLRSETSETTDNRGRTVTTTRYWYDYVTTNILIGGETDGYSVGPVQFPLAGNGPGQLNVANATTPCPANVLYYNIPAQYLLIVDVTYF